MWAPVLECVSGTFKWQAIAPIYLWRPQGLCPRPDNVLFKLAELIGDCGNKHTTTDLCNFLKLSRGGHTSKNTQLRSRSSNHTATEGAPGRGRVGGSDNFQDQQCPSVACLGVQTSGIGSGVQTSKDEVSSVTLQPKNPSAALKSKQMKKRWTREGTCNPNCKVRKMLSPPENCEDQVQILAHGKCSLGAGSLKAESKPSQVKAWHLGYLHPLPLSLKSSLTFHYLLVQFSSFTHDLTTCLPGRKHTS